MCFSKCDFHNCFHENLLLHNYLGYACCFEPLRRCQGVGPQARTTDERAKGTTERKHVWTTRVSMCVSQRKTRGRLVGTVGGTKAAGRKLGTANRPTEKRRKQQDASVSI